MRKDVLIAVIIIAIVASGIVGAMLGDTWKPPPPEHLRPPELQRIAQRDLTPLIVTKAAISTMNMTIAIILIGLYVKLYMEMKSDFTLGLIVLNGALLMYAITSNPVIQIVLGFRSIGLGPFVLIPDAFATVAMCILLYLSLK
jgi:hypothetical protein